MLGFLKKRKTLPPLGIYIATDRIILASSGEQPIFAQKAINEPAEWHRAIAQIVHEHKLPRSDIYLVLGQGLYQQFQVEKPSVPNHELEAAIPFAIKDYLTESVTHLVFDYVDLPSPPTTKARVNVITTQRAHIQKLVDAVRPLGELQIITTEEHALCSLFKDEKEKMQMLLLQPQDQELQLLAFYQEGLCFSRQLRGFKSLTLPSEPTEMLLDSLALEIQRSLDYLQGQLKLPPCAEMQLAISSPHLGALIRHLDTVSLKGQAMANKAILNGIEYLPAFAALNMGAE